MINRKICLRLFSISCSNNHHHHQLFNRHCRRRFCSSMAGGVAPTFYISCKDPAAVRYFSVQKSSFSSAAASSAAVEFRRSISLRIKGCCSSDNSGSNGGGGGGSAFELHKVRATSSPQRVLRELVSEEINNFCLKNRIGSGDGTGAAQIDRGRCLQFPGDRSLSEKIVVAVDVDEVLGNFVSALNRFIADRYSLNHSVSEYHVYEFFKIWNCSRDEADIRVHEFFKTAYFKQGIYPIPGALEALQKLSKFCSFSIVTSRQNAIKDHTIEWIEKHYQGLFQAMHFGNHFALDGKSIPKSEICRSMGAKVLIDDNPRYAIECAKVGIQVLLFDYENSYPWCKTESVKHHPLVTKVHNWEEVEHQLFSWTDS